MRILVLALTAATALVSGGLAGAQAADLYTAPEGPPPAAETPPPEAPPPVAVVPRPPAVVFAEPPCPVVWRCGYWGCGWRHPCAPALAPSFYYGGPRYYGAYRGYRGPYWGHEHWGYRHHWS